MKAIYFILLFLAGNYVSLIHTVTNSGKEPGSIPQPYYSYSEVMFQSDTIYRRLILDTLFREKFWDTIPQTVFWRRIINLPEDSAIMNVASTRQILEIIPVKRYKILTDIQKVAYRDSLKKANSLPDSLKIYFSTGKQYFYKFYNAIPNIDNSIPIFIENGTDPWYAQAILLIESPNKVQKSNVGAYGPFQLMRYVGLKYGLKINKHIDERKSLERSAYAASQFLKQICIPSVREMLDTLHITYNETDLWFRLLTMHVYHAGSGNVKLVLNKIKPTEGGLPLIFKVWQTEAGGFRNASQNYSQVLLATLLQLETIVEKESKEVRLNLPVFAADTTQIRKE